jgi:hypothetical protein
MKARAGLLVVLFLASTLPIVNADESSPVTINVDWTGDHAYIITGDVNLSQISVNHLHNGTELDVGLIYDTTGDNLRIVLNTTLSHGDTITVNAENVSRIVTVGLWGQPLADHEVTLNSHWEMDQQWENENGSQKYILEFDGQGWQQRIGNTLESWEMGNGTLFIISNTEDSGLSMMLDLDSVWKNETTVDGIMVAQVFDARGSGIIGVENDGDESNVDIEGTVSDAWINRSMVNGIVDERFRLEANGTISVLSEEEDESMNLTGELAVLLIETWDSNGTRRLSHTQFEATADLILDTNDSRMDISLDTFESVERWEDGLRVDHLNRMVGHGTFGFSGEDENSSVQINGTIYDFHQEQEDGLVTVDDLHVDGIITGDAQGTFGVVRTIEDNDHSEANATGVMYDVIIVHQEDWFNLTGITALPNSDLGVGAHHNESWSYDAVQSDWDNRTIRTVWSQTGPDPSSGDETHSNSPIQNNPEAPSVEEGIGDATVSRESGFAPIDAATGDTFTLDHQDGMQLTVTAGDLQTIPMDGHMVDTVAWTGVYSIDVSGTANGNLIIDGPLSGLNVAINRDFQIEFGEDEQLVNLTENQSVNRVLSPSIISVHDNHEPIIEAIALAQGVVTGENGAPGYLEVTVSDIDFNIVSVTADTESIGGSNSIILNDKGLDGDRVIGDDIWTVNISVPGLEFGELPISVTVTDVFAASDNKSTNISVLNQPPRLTSIEIVPSIISRGEIMIVNAEVIDGHGVSSVSVDMRDYGGDLLELNRVGDIWAAQIVIPTGMNPGEHLLKIRMVDEFESSITVQRTITSGQHHIQSENDEDISINVMNEPPIIEAGDLRIIEMDGEDVEYNLTISVTDYDGLFWVKVKLGILAPPGQSNTWYIMTSNGDGTYSKQVTIKNHIALGTHEILVKAMDSYGSQTALQSVPVVLEEADNPSSSTGPSSSTMTYIALGGIGILVIVGAVVYIMRGSEEEGGLGGFGEV